MAQDLLDQRSGRSFPITDSDSFFVKLEETLEALKQAARPHPQSVQVAIALAKRYCREDKFSLEWAEFLMGEVEKIRRYVTGPDYPTVNPTNESLNGIVETFMVKTEVLRRACMICGRWGTTESNRVVGRVIQSLSFEEESKGGFTYYIALRKFGASLCYYWNIAGLLDREAWDSIHALQSIKFKNDSESEEAAIILPFASYDTMDWKFLRGLDRRHTPISDYLVEKFTVEVHDIALESARAEDLFDQIELMVSLGFAHRRSYLVAKTGVWFWMPLGRFIWRRSGRILEQELVKIEGFSDGDAFFKSGMLGGTKASAAITLKAIREFHKELGRRYF